MNMPSAPNSTTPPMALSTSFLCQQLARHPSPHLAPAAREEQHLLIGLQQPIHGAGGGLDRTKALKGRAQGTSPMQWVG